MTDTPAPDHIHLKFGHTETLGQTIRMWQASPFEGGIEYVRADPAAQQGAETPAKSDVEQAAFALVNAIEEWQVARHTGSLEVEFAKAKPVVAAKDALRAALSAMGGTE